MQVNNLPKLWDDEVRMQTQVWLQIHILSTWALLSPTYESISLKVLNKPLPGSPWFKRGEFNMEHIWVTTGINSNIWRHHPAWSWIDLAQRDSKRAPRTEYEDSKGDTGQSKGLRIKSRGAASARRWKQRPWEHPQARHSQSSQGRYSTHYTRVQGQGSIWENLWPSPGHLPGCCCSVTKLCMGVN